MVAQPSYSSQPALFWESTGSSFGYRTNDGESELGKQSGVVVNSVRSNVVELNSGSNRTKILTLEEGLEGLSRINVVNQGTLQTATRIFGNINISVRDDMGDLNVANDNSLNRLIKFLYFYAKHDDITTGNTNEYSIYGVTAIYYLEAWGTYGAHQFVNKQTVNQWVATMEETGGLEYYRKLTEIDPSFIVSTFLKNHKSA